MATALTSLISDRAIRDDLAMTGEITLTGQVLPIGGLKEKALAAQRTGIRTIVAPDRNAADIEEIPEHLRRRLSFVWVSEIEQVLAAALQEDAQSRTARRPAARAQAEPALGTPSGRRGSRRKRPPVSAAGE